MKAVFADEVRAGDVVIPERGAFAMIVRGVAVRDDGGCEVEVIDPKSCLVSIRTCSRNAILGLVRRPWAEGKSVQDVLDGIFALASLPGRMWPMSETSRKQLDEKLVRLREALETYELGKQEARVQGVSSDPREAAIDASCGYLGGGPVVR